MKQLLLGQRLRYFREKFGFTQHQIATALDIDRSTYAYYECGKTTPDIYVLCTLSDIFHIPLSEFVQQPS